MATRRVASIDVLRGVALLGILVMNIQAFALPHAAYMNPSAYGSLAGLDGLAWSLSRLLFDFKFISLFSTLFGASLVLAGEASNPKRRLAWLMVFGCLHGYLVWFGDVLFAYGVTGLVLLGVGAKRWTVRRQVTLGFALLLVSPLVAALGGVLLDHLPAALVADVHLHYDASTTQAELVAFRSGWLAQLPFRAAISFDQQTTSLVLETGWRAAGCMLLGMAAVRARVFEKDSPIAWWPWAPLALGFGLLVSGAGLWLQWASNFDFRTWLYAQSLHELGSMGVAAGIGLSVLAWAHRSAGSIVVQAVGRLGRVAFSAYLMHSIVGTLVFYGHGLNQFGTWSRTALFVAPFVFWSLQLVMAWWWTNRFRVGPLEALWRGLSRGDFSLGRVTPETTPS
ncbi:MAG: DUF418 domain-containing protein [Archangiaceae bacterium]|nr:DUF418 domain-containing protein [Archangiaceae bacterium]